MLERFLKGCDRLFCGIISSYLVEPRGFYSNLSGADIITRAVPQITNVLFKIPNLDGYSGFGLLSYDIQIGRDNGLPPYNKMRRLRGLKKANSFADLSDLISPQVMRASFSTHSPPH